MKSHGKMQAIYKQIMDLNTEGMNNREIAEHLNKRGVKTKTGLDWKGHSVSNAIKIHSANLPI